MTLVSVITLTYNSASYVGRGVEATLKAEAEAPEFQYEHIFVDGNSSDQTVEVIRRLIPSAVILYSAGNLAECTILAVSASRGDFIAFIDSDVAVDKTFFGIVDKIAGDIGGIASFANFTGPGSITELWRHRKDIPSGGMVETDRGLGMISTIYRADLVRQLVEHHGIPDVRGYCTQDTDIALGVNDLGFRTLIDFTGHSAHFRRNGLFNEMRRNFMYGSSIRLMFEKHPKYRKAFYKKRLLSFLVSVCFPYNLIFYSKKVSGLRFAVYEWLISLAYNVGWAFSSYSQEKRYRS